MGKEIERRFLLTSLPELTGAKIQRIEQGFLSNHPDKVIRIRIVRDLIGGEKKAFFTVKGKQFGATRQEIEFEAPVIEAEDMLCDFAEGFIIYKNRHTVKLDGHVWEIDVFLGRLQGLIIAEVELDSEDEYFVIQDWAKQEITGDHRYSNSNLSKMATLSHLGTRVINSEFSNA